MKLELKSIENYCITLEKINEDLKTENQKLKDEINYLRLSNKTLGIHVRQLISER